MKRFFTFLILIIVANISFAQVTVTFNVDMTDAQIKNGAGDDVRAFDAASDEVYIAGSIFGSWATPGSDVAYKMTDADGDLIYTIEAADVAAGTVQYKYFAEAPGSLSWDCGEWTGDPNREITVGTSAMTTNDLWSDIANSISDTKENSINIYPNPSNGVFTINAKGFAVNVFDITGKAVTVAVSGNTVDMSNAQAGVYFVRLTSDNAVITKRVVIK